MTDSTKNELTNEIVYHPKNEKTGKKSRQKPSYLQGRRNRRGRADDYT